MALLGFALLLFFFPPLVRLLAEWPWFTALGFERVYATRLIASALLGLVTGGFAFAFLYANLRFAQRGAVPNPVEVRMNPERPALDEQALRQLPPAAVRPRLQRLRRSLGRLAGLIHASHCSPR